MSAGFLHQTAPSVWRQRFLLAMVVGGLVMTSIGWYRSEHKSCLKWATTQADEQLVYGKHFFNETVELDGKKFDHCTFEDVTFLYHATAPVDFVESSFTHKQGHVMFLKTDNDAAKGFMKFAYLMQGLPNMTEIVAGEVDKNGNVKPFADFKSAPAH